MAKRLIAICMICLLASLIAVPAQAVGERVLYWGNTGGDVTQVQQRLIWWGYMQGSTDGVYGAQTYQAVRLFQSRNGLNVSGNVDAGTFRALGFNPTIGFTPTVNKTAAVQSTGTTSSGDLYLLAKIVYGEARGEIFEGKVAIAAVVLNRVRSPLFPNTVAGVIYEPGAFTAVSDGQFYLQPDQNSYKAAQLALDGWDPSYGALYYFNPATATSPWIWSRPYLMTIGSHRFLK